MEDQITLLSATYIFVMRTSHIFTFVGMNVSSKYYTVSFYNVITLQTGSFLKTNSQQEMLNHN